MNGFAPFPHRIYINRRKFPHFDDQDLAFLGLLFHEAWHQVQIKQVGWLRWIWQYLTNPIYRLWWEMSAHVFGDQQRYVVYPEERMKMWVEKSVPSYFPWHVSPITDYGILYQLPLIWDDMKEIAVVLEYEL